MTRPPVDVPLVFVYHHAGPVWIAATHGTKWDDWRGFIEMSGGHYLALPQRGRGGSIVVATMPPPAHLGAYATEFEPKWAALVMRHLTRSDGYDGWQASEFWSAMAVRCRE